MICTEKKNFSRKLESSEWLQTLWYNKRRLLKINSKWWQYSICSIQITRVLFQTQTNLVPWGKSLMSIWNTMEGLPGYIPRLGLIYNGRSPRAQRYWMRRQVERGQLRHPPEVFLCFKLKHGHSATVKCCCPIVSYFTVLLTSCWCLWSTAICFVEINSYF